ncbi:fasciclin domain-containing protein [Cryptosporangium aurantiacum]|uniref:Uncaracterized surface protein containing fasciclin (FAS1) repeats n=1 Tax=Cryptosporangium aurantiacum TaxID=134849 RepID=A0A1M7I263_9ACTN|nr:fasciclin domain-containing protein [Cryptosporangium aurantiacum]SHM34810.1 Uncaracterized surface protein containing fasciclin (FAS1) repeats [Cryptosporangium aurantiacum]
MPSLRSVLPRRRWLLVTLGLVVAVGLGVTWAVAGQGEEAPVTTQAMSTSVPTDPTALFGAGCDALPDGSSDPAAPAGMRGRPVREIVEHHPQLTTLRDAVEKAGMLRTFDDRTGLTMLLPTDAAFDKVPGWQLKLALSNRQMLTDILTYHVIEKPLNPKQLNLDGPFTTLEGSELRVRGFGESLRLGVQNAHVICGNIPTKNATIYLIDTVLLPT